MAKKKSSRKRRNEAWTGADHIVRRQTQTQKEDETTQKKVARSERLSHGTKAKKEKQKLEMHIAKTKRELDRLKERLENWDDVAEEEDRRKKKQQEGEEEEARLKQEQGEDADEQPKKRRRRRPGPETWKLRGAARPAWEVYDFDTRYVDPFQKEHDEARAKAQRSRNLFVVYKQKFGSPEAPPACREYLSLLMRLGLLYWQAQKMKSARQYFLECMELDSASAADADEGRSHSPITTARCRLMRLYMEANRPDSARRLWERKLSPEDPSVWIRYSAALIEYVSWKVLKEEGSTSDKAEQALALAIRTNPFCAYYMAFHEHFQQNMEYTEEIEDATDVEPLEEAIEYCNSEQIGAWMGTEGALEWVRHILWKGLQDKSSQLKPSDMDWRGKLDKLQETYGEQVQELSGNPHQDDDDEEEEEDEVDFLMFSGMFRTSMEMLEEQGELTKKVEFKIEDHHPPKED